MQDQRLSSRALKLITDPENNIMFSVASLWEIAIKNALKRHDFRHDAGQMRAGLLANDYEELDIVSRHIMTFKELSPSHRDPFDRLLLAQALAEGVTLLTADERLAAYDKSVLLV